MEEDKIQDSQSQEPEVQTPDGRQGSPDGQQRVSQTISREIYQELTPKSVETEHLKNVIVSLSSKIVTTNDLERELETVVTTLNQNEEARVVLQSQLGESSNLAQQRSEETKAREDELNTEISRLRTRVDELGADCRDREQTIHERDHEITEKNKEINNLNMSLSDLTEMKALNEKYADQVNDAENSRIELQKDYEDCLDKHQEQLKHEHKER